MGCGVALGAAIPLGMSPGSAYTRPLVSESGLFSDKVLALVCVVARRAMFRAVQAEILQE